MRSPIDGGLSESEKPPREPGETATGFALAGRPTLEGDIFVNASGKSADAPNGVVVGCFAAFVIEEAKKGGFSLFANSLEACFGDFLKSLPKDQRQQTLALSYHLAAVEPASEPFRLRLVHSQP